MTSGNTGNGGGVFTGSTGLSTDAWQAGTHLIVNKWGTDIVDFEVRRVCRGPWRARVGWDAARCGRDGGCSWRDGTSGRPHAVSPRTEARALSPFSIPLTCSTRSSSGRWTSA